MIDLNNHLEKWVGEGIVTAEQAELMRRSVVAQPPPSPAFPEDESRIPIVAEIFGYVGAALAIWAAVFLASEFWGNLADWAQAGLFAAAALVLFAAGSALLDAAEPALDRLSGVLWAGSVIALGGALYLVLDPIIGFSVDATWAVIGTITAAAGAAMLRRRQKVAQHVMLFASVMTAIMWLLDLGAEPEIFVYGFVAWGIGLVWVLVTRAGVLPPAGTGMVLGAVAMLYGAQLAVVDGETDAFGILLGLATAGLFATGGVLLRERLTIVLGGIGIFWFVPQAMFHFFGETFAGMFGLFLSGLAIVALAIWFSRHREAM